MANKKKIEERLKAQQKKRTERTIQFVGGGILILVVIGLIWLWAPRQNSSVLELPTIPPAVSQMPQVTAKQYDSYPPMTIDPSKRYFAKFVMAKGGEFTAELYPDKAPLAVNSFIFLAREGFYDGVTFHRVIDNFMAQSGDPGGLGNGGPGYIFANEDNDLLFDKPGVLGMGNRGRDTNGSQFFITFVPYPSLNGNYTAFGQVIDGMEVVNAITRRDPTQNPTFPGDAIESVTISEE